MDKPHVLIVYNHTVQVDDNKKNDGQTNQQTNERVQEREEKKSAHKKKLQIVKCRTNLLIR